MPPFFSIILQVCNNIKTKRKAKQYNKLTREREIGTSQNVPLLKLMSDNLGSKGGAVMTAIASHQCGLGSNPGGDAIICGLSLLLVLSLAPRGFSLGTPVFPSVSLKPNTSKIPI